MPQIISQAAIDRRRYWVEEIVQISGNFGNDSVRLANELLAEIQKSGLPALLDHLRLCGDIPESYDHDSSEEKLYSKYTDSLLAAAFSYIGMTSLVLTERADAADVEVVTSSYSFVADAKSFRLSRTAKNQKDFKVQAMDGWKHGKPYAMVVCPIYQLPTKSSQIYQQASARNVCIFTYSHLAVLASYIATAGHVQAEALLKKIFDVIPAMNPSKDANSYWLGVNRTMLEHAPEIAALWAIEKQAAVESIVAAKREALVYLAAERTKIMRMTHAEALAELIRVQKLESRIRVIESVTDNGILEVR